MRQEKEIPNGIILHLMEQEELCPEPKQKNELSLDQYKEEMAGVYTTSVNENTLDEAPMAYKSLESIVDNIADTVEILEILKPIYNFKAN